MPSKQGTLELVDRLLNELRTETLDRLGRIEAAVGLLGSMPTATGGLKQAVSSLRVELYPLRSQMADPAPKRKKCGLINY